MKAIVRNVLLACLISTFCFFGAVGRRPVAHNGSHPATIERTPAQISESRKETLSLLAVAALAWALCYWRCAAINRRLNQERIYKMRFDQHMRQNVFSDRRFKA